MADPAKSRRCEVAHAQHAQTIQQSNFKQNPPSFIEAQLAKIPKKWLILTAKLQPLAGEIAWTKNTLILDRCQNLLQRVF